jgi:trimethylamine--corrinoid protein Co-methyltransferase
MARYLGLPMWSTGGCTDAKILDEQAALESALSLAMAGLSGGNLVHDVGYSDSGLTGSIPLLVLGDEIIGMVKRILRGMEVDAETLALEVIDGVGPGGKFVSEDHTYNLFRRDSWFPSLMDRTTVQTWEADGGKTMGDRVTEKINQILEEHQVPPLEESTLSDFENILARAVARAEGREN